MINAPPCNVVDTYIFCFLKILGVAKVADAFKVLACFLVVLTIPLTRTINLGPHAGQEE